MVNFYKYLPVSKEDESWGLCVLNAGRYKSDNELIYPPIGHPVSHYFSWNQGRVLHNEYSLIYITRGSGVFESKSIKSTIIKEGTIIILFPEEWHRYKPNEETGWDEYWVGFKGDIIENLITNSFFTPQNAVLKIGIKDEMLLKFTEIIETIGEEKAGYQPLVSSAVMHLLGCIHYLQKQKTSKEEDFVEMIVNKARILLRENIDLPISLEEIAKELNVSYSWFRKTFKAYTGIAPGQYLIQLKIEKAKALLSIPKKPIKNIADELMFESTFYFCRLFKEKTGLTPKQYREKIGNK